MSCTNPSRLVINWNYKEGSYQEKTLGEKNGRRVDHKNVHINDLKFVQALRNRDEAAFGILLTYYYTVLLRLAMKFVPSLAVAEEVVQETFVGVLEGINRFQGRSSFKTWLFRILINRAKTRGVSENRYVSFDFCSYAGKEQKNDFDQFISALPGDDLDPERAFLSKEGFIKIQAAIRALPPNQREVIVMRDLEESNSKEVCALLGLSETNQRVLHHRVRSKVRRALDQ